ncbi:MAG: hypothetical protein RBT78_10555, partial [Kiritimatiellia bacterium]|nr:hypothetical protein [Kiritimatiellia bacterium]
MMDPDIYFEDLLRKVLDEVATEDEFATFQEILLHDAELRALYVQCARAHAALCCRNRRAAAVPARDRAPVIREPAPQRGRPRRVRPGGIAAAAALAVLAGVLFTLSRRVPFTPAPVPAPPPVTALHHYGSAGLELPRTLPGTVRLLGGMARVSLPSGVELI